MTLSRAVLMEALGMLEVLWADASILRSYFVRCDGAESMASVGL